MMNTPTQATSSGFLVLSLLSVVIWLVSAHAVYYPLLYFGLRRRAVFSLRLAYLLSLVMVVFFGLYVTWWLQPTLLLPASPAGFATTHFGGNITAGQLSITSGQANEVFVLAYPVKASTCDTNQCPGELQTALRAGQFRLQRFQVKAKPITYQFVDLPSDQYVVWVIPNNAVPATSGTSGSESALQSVVTNVTNTAVNLQLPPNTVSSGASQLTLTANPSSGSAPTVAFTATGTNARLEPWSDAVASLARAGLLEVGCFPLWLTASGSDRVIAVGWFRGIPEDRSTVTLPLDQTDSWRSGTNVATMIGFPAAGAQIPPECGLSFGRYVVATYDYKR